MRLAAYLLLGIAQLQTVSFGLAFVGDKCIGPEIRNGVCKMIKDCPSVQEDYMKGKRPVSCGFEGIDPIVCCPSSEIQASTSRVPGETAKKWCKEYQTSCPKPVFEQESTATPIASGQLIPAGKYPHTAVIGFGELKDIQWACGGSLISEKFILTAAHCLRPRQADIKWVLLGSNMLINTTDMDGSNGQIHPILRSIPHPEYKPPAVYNDIALLEIGPAVTPNPRPLDSIDLHPACLTENRTYEGKYAIATGWETYAAVDYDSKMAIIETTMEVYKTSVCLDAFETQISSKKKLNLGITSSMLCVGVKTGEKEPCQGGGPLQVPIGSGCMYELWGVSSFGKACGFGTPSIFTRVYDYVPWIEDIVWPA